MLMVAGTVNDRVVLLVALAANTVIDASASPTTSRPPAVKAFSKRISGSLLKGLGVGRDPHQLSSNQSQPHLLTEGGRPAKRGACPAGRRARGNARLWFGARRHTGL